jgi:hypothetical protein
LYEPRYGPLEISLVQTDSAPSGDSENVQLRFLAHLSHVSPNSFARNG